MSHTFYNSLDLTCKSPFGAVKAGQPVTFNLTVPEDLGYVDPHLVLTKDREDPVHYRMEFTGQTPKVNHFALTVTPTTSGLYFYHFDLYTDFRRIYRTPGGEGVLSWTDGQDWQLTVYEPDFKTPDWLKNGTMYQIFPDRFCEGKPDKAMPFADRIYRADKTGEPYFWPTEQSEGYLNMDYYGGDFAGIQQKLPYLRDLGVTCIYLNPIFRARSNHRYDTGDYTQVDPLCGTNTEFTELCEAAKKVGIRVMLDGVFSHTGEDSVYFNHFGHYPTLGAYQGQSSPYYDWYTFNHYPEDYKAWWGILSLPELRKDNPEYQKFMFQPHEGVVPRWIEAGSCGWRLDVADELPVDFLRKLRAAAKAADPEAVVLGEVWEDASNKVAYGETRCYCTGDTLDSVMNYPVREAILNFVMGKTSASTFVRLIHHQEEVYPAQFRYALMNLVGSHDRCRALNILAGRECQELSKADQQHVHLNVEEYELAVRRYKLCIDLLCALPGCATVYYGDEVGLTGCHDPWNRRAFPWGREDKSLQKYVANKLRHRQESDLLRLGYCDIEAPDDDTLLITRRMKDGHDALGQESTVTGKEIIKVCRKLH